VTVGPHLLNHGLQIFRLQGVPLAAGQLDYVFIWHGLRWAFKAWAFATAQNPTGTLRHFRSILLGVSILIGYVLKVPAVLPAKEDEFLLRSQQATLVPFMDFIPIQSGHCRLPS
jgi:hypothetical protein